jgi:hypothetical protein
MSYVIILFKGEIKSTLHVVDLDFTGAFTNSISSSLIVSILYPNMPAITSLKIKEKRYHLIDLDY